jgi:GTP-binding protein HflX
LFERPKTGELALLVHINIASDSEGEDLGEFIDLAVSAGAQVVETISGARYSPEAKYFIGTGKAEEIKQAVKAHGAEIVLVNHSLSPSQERNLESLLECRVLDRTGLILDIFAQRARSHEGKLQVELAQLKHLMTRLVRGWTHLERQKGGIGLRGPGETQLETDRRLIGGRLKQLTSRLKKVQQQRQQSRKSRRRAELPTVAFVGYTNAGKSTLFNRLSSASVYAADQLFATLDPTLRRIQLSDGDYIVLADTVGFIRHLPHDLVEAFKSTLQETRDADLLVHVIDASDEERRAKIEQVHDVLVEIEADEVPQLEVYNKIDLIENSSAQLLHGSDGQPDRIYLSAVSGEGLELFREWMRHHFGCDKEIMQFNLPPDQPKLRARLFEVGRVIEEHYADDGNSIIKVEIRPQQLNQLRKQDIFIDNYLVSGENTSQN